MCSVCVSEALTMTEGFWQNGVTLFYQVNLCGGGQLVCVYIYTVRLSAIHTRPKGFHVVIIDFKQSKNKRN